MSKETIAEAKDLLTRWEEGEIDNAADGIQEAHELLEALPASEKKLRAQLEELRDECGRILQEVYG